jgi:CheY-like chemotaxis protein
LRSFLTGIIEMCRIRAEQKKISFFAQLDSQIPIAVYSDEKRLRQVLLNLIGNAVKFTEEGKVLFNVQLISHNNNHNFSTDELTSQVNITPLVQTIRFEIIDTGVGMTTEQLDKIFLPFEQAGEKAKQAEGTGLGLAISSKIAELMGSKIFAESELGRGSKFWLDLDFTVSSEWIQPTPLSLVKNVVAIRSNKSKILIVDDQWENRSVIANLLTPIGFSCFEANNGQEALYQAEYIRPDLIITDLAMPIMDGFELMRALNNHPTLHNIVVIVSSASVFEADRNNSLAAGGDDFLPKPIQLDELLKILEKYLHVEFVYADDSQPKTLTNQHNNLENELILPSQPEIDKILDLAMRGNIKGIQELLNTLEVTDVKYIPFVVKVRELANSFQTKKIKQYIQSIKGNVNA